jgi:serine/threonine protein phosphatase PrpC
MSFYRSFEQYHNSNYPYQIGGENDDPNDAIDIVHTIKDRDIIIMGSDGLFNNYYFSRDFHITIWEELVYKDYGGLLRSSPQSIAEKIAKKAGEHRADETWKSPKSIAAEEKTPNSEWGKKDDISVIFSQIKLNEKIDKS